MVGIIDKMHPYTIITSTERVSTKNCAGMHLIPTIIVSVLFDPTIPTWSSSAIFSCILEGRGHNPEPPVVITISSPVTGSI